MTTTVPSVCRICNHCCSVLVDVEDGRATRVRGDAENPVYQGYTCVKGRSQPAYLDSLERILRPLHRDGSGEFRSVGSGEVVRRIADRLSDIVDRHGPRSVALYLGTSQCMSNATAPFGFAFMRALGSPMCFTPNTIDKPGKSIAKALHGSWMAPPQEFDEPRSALLIGVNPVVSHKGLPKGRQGRWLRDARAKGMVLSVVDPRRTETAKRADIHLQPRPGHDAEILAAILHVVLKEDLGDPGFVRDETVGIEALRRAVAPFEPRAVAAAADCSAADLVEIARVHGRAGRGYAMAGTGPNMSGPGTLVEYLVLCLEAVCGHYLRAGDAVRNPGTLVPSSDHRAQARPPGAARLGERMRVRGLTATPAGLPTAALAEEILTPGEGQVKALISCGGNPLAAWPDQLRTLEALRSLDLLVQIDPWMSQTAREAHFVIGPTMPLEVPGSTAIIDLATHHQGVGYGPVDAYGQYTPAVVDPPENSDVIEEWAFFHSLAREMGLALQLGETFGGTVADAARIDPASEPSSEQVLGLVLAGSRVPLDEVRKHPHGALFPAPGIVVEPKEPGWTGRLDLANAEMMDELTELTEVKGGSIDDLRLICRRLPHVYNSSCRDAAAFARAPEHNPAFLHPADLRAREVVSGDLVEISSGRGTVTAVARADESLRPGLVALTHGFGGLPGDEADAPRQIGANVDRLLDVTHRPDRFSGQPLMSNVPVRVQRVPPEAATRGLS
ncbi:molybdopterin-containing oxidoreductase family protein [Pseudonocardia xishanensis]|uniref:Molybdopterin-dependent oxidoreductase n=1 Tax=Pseudonocardia xishanensis TaxID=630995 RepID=A0ABP8RYR7_9PSEU